METLIGMFEGLGLEGVLALSAAYAVCIGSLLGFITVYAMFAIWMERKVAAHIQVRYGPMETGAFHEMSEHPRSFAISFRPMQLRRRRWRWAWMRAWSRTLGLVRLLKTAFTFGDWVPYVLWKLERHTGRRIELSPRQRAHPLIYAWPIILPLLMRRNLREID